MNRILDNPTKVRLFFLNHSSVDIDLRNAFKVIRSVCWQGSGQRLTQVEDLEGNDISEDVRSQINSQLRDWINS